ncbi:MAG: deoxyribonuclease IV [Desulfobulbaceae bacterium]|nr:MAG: deoxyribonuclease IV [Desulfobulbaceae bacterium]
MPYLGAHESVSKGLHLAFERIEKVGGESLQIFTRNQRQWQPKPLADEELTSFSEARQQFSDMLIASHASYLVNLASGKEELREKSINAFVAELERCHQLQVPYVVLHPGSHTGDGVELGIERFVSALDQAIERAESDSMVLIENTAGQGTGLGSCFEEIASIRAQTAFGDKVGVCLDTCHLFASGYDFRQKSDYDQVMADFDKQIGLSNLYFFHLNDSKKECGSRVDRHEHIGQGCIGLEGFRHLLNDPRFQNHPMTLETPKGEDLQEDIMNLQTLRSLIS